MNSKTILSLAIVAISSVAMAAAESQSVESTKTVFTTSGGSVDVAHSTKEYVTTTPESFTSLLSGVSNVRITGTITPTFNATDPTTTVTPPQHNSSNPQAALIAYDGKWYGWSSYTLAWSEITGSEATEGEANNVMLEFSATSFDSNSDGDGDAPGVTYTVPNGLGGTVSATLRNSGTFTSISKLAFSGYGSYGAFDGLTFETMTITVDTSVSEVSDVIEAAGGTLNSVGDNGLTAWETLVLGLEDTETAVYTAPVQINDTNKLGFKLGNAFKANYGVTGATVTYKVQKFSADTGEYVDESDVTNGDETAYVDVPTSGVQYYKIKITIQ